MIENQETICSKEQRVNHRFLHVFLLYFYIDLIQLRIPKLRKSVAV